MINFSIRIRLIYVPFLLISVAFISVYTFLDWLFVIRLEIPLNDELVHYWLVVALSCIPILIWLRPRIKLLVLKDKKGNLPFLYHFIAIIAIAAPTIIAQDYLVTATGRLTVLQNINQINNKPLTKYYKLRQYFIDKQNIAVYRRTATSGRSNETLSLYIDVACPILTDTLKPARTITVIGSNGKKPLIIIDGIPENSRAVINKINPANIQSVNVLNGTAAMALYGAKGFDGAIVIVTKNAVGGDGNFLSTQIPQAWLCIEFSKSISNNLNQGDKENQFRAFDTLANNEFRAKNLNRFVYLDRISANSRRKGYLKAIKNRVGTVNSPVIFEAKDEPYEARNGNKFGWILKSFGIGAAIWLLMIIIPKFNNLELKKRDSSGLSDWEAFSKSITLIKFKGNFKITVVIVSLNVLVFIIMVFAGLGVISFDSHDLLAWGADYRPAIINGQWWRLITSVFLHGGLMHLLMNMYGLFFAAIFLEPLLGSIRYATAYLICGIVSSLASIWWHTATVSIGASGAIFGLYGILTALLTTKKIDINGKKGLLLFSLFFIVINLLVGLTGGIDNAAHVGGLLSGLILGYIFYFFTDLPKAKEKNDEPQNLKHISTEVNNSNSLN